MNARNFSDGNWSWISNNIFDRFQEIGTTGFAVYAWLCRHADLQGRCWPSARRLADVIGVSENCIRVHLRRLKKLGLISEERRPGRLTNVYTLLPATSMPEANQACYPGLVNTHTNESLDSSAESQGSDFTTHVISGIEQKSKNNDERSGGVLFNFSTENTYRIWIGRGGAWDQRDQEWAERFVEVQGQDRAERLLGALADILGSKWPECRYLAHGWDKYGALAVKKLAEDEAAEIGRRRHAEAEEERRQKAEERILRAADERAFKDKWLPIWNGLPRAEQERIESVVLQRVPNARVMKVYFEELCLHQLSQQPV